MSDFDSCQSNRTHTDGLHNWKASQVVQDLLWHLISAYMKCLYGWAGVRYVMTKFSRMDSLPNFVTHGAPLRAFHAGESSAVIYSLSFAEASLCRIVGRLGKRKRKRACSHRPPPAFYFSIIAIFIGIHSGSLYGGESYLLHSLKVLYLKCDSKLKDPHALQFMNLDSN